MPTEGEQEGLQESVPQEQMSAKRPIVEQGPTSPQEAVLSQTGQTEKVGLIKRAMMGVVNILKDIGSGKAQKLSTHGPRPLDTSEQTQSPQNEPSNP